MPLKPLPDTDADEFSMFDLWGILWSGKWLIVGLTLVFTAAGIAYALYATEWFRSEVQLMPVTSKSTSGLSPQLGGLASLAGINLGGASANAEPLAVLKSREFIRAFIEDQQLLHVLFADEWDAKAQRWKSDNPKRWRDSRDAVRYFEKNVRRVVEDKKTGLVALSIEWKDAETAAAWANLLVVRVNDKMRKRALAEAETNVSFLRKEIAATNVVALQQSMGKLLESEMEKMMLARGESEYSFRVVDPATPSKWRSRPDRIQVVVLAIVGGCVVSVGILFLMQAARRYRSQRAKHRARLAMTAG